MSLSIPSRIKKHLEVGDKVWLINDFQQGQGEIIQIDKSFDDDNMYFVEFSKEFISNNAYYKEKQLC